MLAFILRRLLQAVIVMLAVAFIAFCCSSTSAIRWSFLLGQDATPEQIARSCAPTSGSTSPSSCSSWHFLGNAVQGEFGSQPAPGRARCRALIVERFPATLELALVAALLALLVGIPMGVYTALRRGNFVAGAGAS